MRKKQMMAYAAAVLTAALVLGACGAKEAGSAGGAGKSFGAKETSAGTEAAKEAGDPKDAAGDAAGAAEDAADAGSAAEKDVPGNAGAAGTQAPAAPTLAEKLAGRYLCGDAEDGTYVLELMDVYGNLYAKGGTAMESGEDGFPEPYSFWAMEIVPEEAGALQSTEADSADVGVMTFSVMSNEGKYWGAPAEGMISLTADGVAFTGKDGGAEPLDGRKEKLEFRRYEEKDASDDASLPGLYSPALPAEWGGEIPDALYGLWKEKGADTPFFLEFSEIPDAEGKPRGAFRVYRKAPGTEVELGDGAFLFTEAPEGTPQGAEAAGNLLVSCTALGTGDMPKAFSHDLVLTDKNTLTFKGDPAGGTSADSIFSAEQDTVFERAAVTDVPLNALAEPDDVRAVSHELTAETPEGTRGVVPQFRASDDVENNGGHFLRVGDLVFFRDMREGLKDVTATWGSFIDMPELGEGSAVLYYDRRTGKTGTAFRDNGYGPLWYQGGRIWSAEQVPSDGNYTVQDIHACWPDGSGLRNIGGGSFVSVRGVSEDQKLLAATEYREGDAACRVYGGGRYPIASYEPQGSEYIVYSGFSGNDLVLVTCPETGKYQVLQLCTDTGDIVRLGLLPMDEDRQYCSPDIVQCETWDGQIWLGVGWFAGTGHFLNLYDVVRMTSRKADSLETMPLDDTGFNIDEHGITPRFFLNGADELLLSDHDPDGEVYLSEFSWGDLIYQDSPYSAILLKEGFIGESESMGYAEKGAKILQAAEIAGGAAWIVTAEASRAPEMDIGWREAYSADRMTWQRIQVTDVTLPAGGGLPAETILEGAGK